MGKANNSQEFEIIAQIKKTLDSFALPKVSLSIGDDAALVDHDLCCLDILQENVHFSFDYFSYADLGYKSLAANLSDIAAMGGIPKYALVGLGLTTKTTAEQVVDFYKGLGELAVKYQCAVVGGDISQSTQVYSSVAVVGEATPENIMKRSGGRDGDYLLVSNHLGLSALYLKAVREQLNVPALLLNKLKEAHLHPIPRLDLGQMLAENDCHCAIDCSDGFLQDVGHILDASNVGLDLNTDSLPLDTQAVQFFGRQTVLRAALEGGEDFELIFSIRPQDYNKISGKTPLPLNIVGKLTREHKGQIIDQNGRLLERKGYRHFD